MCMRAHIVIIMLMLVRSSVLSLHTDDRGEYVQCNLKLSCNAGNFQILYSKKFSSAKNFVKSDRQAVRQEFIFVKRRSSLVCSSVVVALLLIVYLRISDPTLIVYKKI